MSLISKKEQLMHIPLYYIEKEVRGFTKIIILEEEKAKKMIAEQESKKEEKTKVKVECLNTFWKPLTWKEQNQITKLCQVTGNNAEGTPSIIDIDYFKLRDLRIKMCLKKWDMKDEEGKAIEANPTNIDLLSADVVYALSARYDEAMNLTEDEIKN